MQSVLVCVLMRLNVSVAACQDGAKLMHKQGEGGREM